MPVLVSDTSPIRALEFLGHLHWLDRLFGSVHLPSEVSRELAHPPVRFASLDVTQYPFLVV
jgi:predicted nucleic acid-binding protein